MNTYVLIARHLGKVSGEKIYSYNKLKYMLSKEWRVLFISCKEEHTPVDGTAHYSHYVDPALTYAPECYTRREIKKTVEDIVAFIGDLKDDQCIIESDSVNRAVWAELIAAHIGARHLVFLLQETHFYNEETRKFLRFKYNRHELAGITDKSVSQMLGDDSLEKRDDAKITACCNNVVEECEDVFSSKLSQDAKYTFGSIGRLDKGCVPAILDGFKAYASRHPEEKYNVVLIGGAMGEKRIQQIKDQMEECDCFHLLITGYIYPIPASLIRNVDVFVSTSGSSNVSYRYHRPTVKVHPTTGEPVGILGLDELEGKTMYDVMPGVTVADCLERALLNAGKIEYIYNYHEDYYEKMYAEFERQLSFVDYVKEKEYYDPEKLVHLRTTHIKGHLWHWIVGHLAGADSLNRIIGLYKRLRKVGK